MEDRVAATADQPVDRFVAIGGRRHHYLEWPSKSDRTLLLAHGGFSSARGTWTRIAPALADRYRIVAPDLRGHGETDWDPEAGYTLTQFAKDFERFAEQLGLTAFDLIGHSLGGLIALVYAADHPESVRRLVLIDSGPREVSASVAGRRRMPERPLSFSSREEAEAFARQSFPEGARGRSLEYGFIQRADGSWTWRTDVAGMARARIGEDLLRQRGLWPAFEALKCPTLILIAGKSGFFDRTSAQRMSHANRLALVRTYADANHWLHDDEPERFVQDVRAFFDIDA